MQQEKGFKQQPSNHLPVLCLDLPDDGCEPVLLRTQHLMCVCVKGASAARGLKSVMDSGVDQATALSPP